MFRLIKLSFVPSKYIEYYITIRLDYLRRHCIYGLLSDIKNLMR